MVLGWNRRAWRASGEGHIRVHDFHTWLAEGGASPRQK